MVRAKAISRVRWTDVMTVTIEFALVVLGKRLTREHVDMRRRSTREDRSHFLPTNRSDACKYSCKGGW